MAVPADDSISGGSCAAPRRAQYRAGRPRESSCVKNQEFGEKDALFVTILRGEDAVRPTCELKQSLAVSSSPSLHPQVSLASVNSDQLSINLWIL